MSLRRSLLLTLSLSSVILVGCNGSETQPDDQGAKLGEFCGGIAALPCEEGLTCKLDGDYPDAGGTCVAS